MHFKALVKTLSQRNFIVDAILCQPSNYHLHSFLRNSNFIKDIDKRVKIIPPLQSDWFGSSVYEHVHPEDVEKVREQLSTQEPANQGRILDLKTGTVKKEGHQCKYLSS